MPASRFEKLPRSLLDSKKGQRLLDVITQALDEQVETPPGVLKLDRLASMPPEVQTVYWLWRFQCEAGCGGIEVFILDWLGLHTREVHAALGAVGARELVRRLEAAIPLARSSAAEFTRMQDQTWFDQFPRVREFPTLQSVDQGVFPIIGSLTDAIEHFVRANSRVFFED